jgi:enoyl-CoA hydratase/carnithine racemase
LGKDGSDWAHETIAAMKAMSPTSLKVALRQIRLGADMNFQEVMTMEYRLSQALVRRHDFYEGIRAALIDKDRQPKWNPSDIREVSEDTVKSYFDSLGDNDLILS